MAVAMNWGVIFVGVLIMTALPFRVHITSHDFWKLPKQRFQERALRPPLCCSCPPGCCKQELDTLQETRLSETPELLEIIHHTSLNDCLDCEGSVPSHTAVIALDLHAVLEANATPAARTTCCAILDVLVVTMSTCSQQVVHS